MNGFNTLGWWGKNRVLPNVGSLNRGGDIILSLSLYGFHHGAVLVFFGQRKRGMFLSLPWKLVKHVTSKHHLNWIYVCRFWKWAAWHVELSTMLSVFLSRIIFLINQNYWQWDGVSAWQAAGPAAARLWRRRADVGGRGGAGRGSSSSTSRSTRSLSPDRWGPYFSMFKVEVEVWRDDIAPQFLSLGRDRQVSEKFTK